MTTIRLLRFLLAGLIGASLHPLEAATRDPAGAPFRVLVFSKTLGYRHDSITNGIAAIRGLGSANGFAVEATEDSGAFTTTNLARFRTVVFMSVTGDVLDMDQERALRDYIENGGGFAAIHGSIFGPLACEDKWAWYGEMFCCAFTNHSRILPATVDIEDSHHPSTSGLPSRWERTDEWYNYTGTPRGCARILATVDESTYQGGTMGRDHPIAWCRPVGKGRMWYTAMGHTGSSFGEPLFLGHLLGGIQYSANPPATLVKERNFIKASIGDRTLFEYRFAPDTAFKPYIFQLYSPGGAAVLRDAAPDHVHHHGLMFAIGVDGVSFWEEILGGRPSGGRQIPLQTDMSGGQITQQLDWQGTNGAVLLRETRTITPKINQDVTLLTWRSRLATPAGRDAVSLTGHHYYGLGARLLGSMDKVSTFMNSTGDPGETVRGDERLVSAAWVAGVGPAGGRPVTIAIFEHPGNLRYPAKKFTMSAPFAYLSTTLNWSEPFQLKAGEPLDLCYGVAVWDGRMDKEKIGKAYREWLESTGK